MCIFACQEQRGWQIEIRPENYTMNGRSFDTIIRTDLNVTETDIQALCAQMKEIAIANSQSDYQRESVRDVTKNILLSWGILKEGDDKKIYPAEISFSAIPFKVSRFFNEALTTQSLL